MFAIIETNGATHIAIAISHEGADKSLPAIAAMLEGNATFIRKGWQEVATVKPVMSITLGDTFVVEGDGQEVLVTGTGRVIDDSFVIATPEVFTSNAKGLKTAREDNDKLRTELRFIKDELGRTREMVRKLTENEAESA